MRQTKPAGHASARGWAEASAASRLTLVVGVLVAFAGFVALAFAVAQLAQRNWFEALFAGAAGLWAARGAVELLRPWVGE